MNEGPARADDAAIVDVAILGAGPTGLALAAALAGSAWRVALIDAADATRSLADPRALALSEGSRHLLERLGAWPASATPIETIRVSQQGGPGEALLSAIDEKVPALGYVVPYRDLVGALLARLLGVREPGAGAILDGRGPDPGPPPVLRWNARLLAAAPVDGSPVGRGFRLDLAGPDVARSGRSGVAFRPQASGSAEAAEAVARGDASTAPTLYARVLVHAEGATDDGAFVADYGQCAIVCEARSDPPHGGRAQERFTPDGPLALLPLGPGYSVVCVVPATRRDELMALDDAGFAALLAEKMDGDMRFSALTARSAHPLRLRLRRKLAAGREVWIGNAAQTLHPVSGQGFNLALRDAWTLADRLLLEEAPVTLRDRHLAAWARDRQADRLGGAAFTDGIVRLFSNDLPPLAAARGAGLALLDRLPLAKSFVARRMIYGARAW